MPAKSPPYVLFSDSLRHLVEDPSSATRSGLPVESAVSLRKIIGVKAAGLLRLPPSWTVAQFAVIPTYVCAEYVGTGSDQGIARASDQIASWLRGCAPCLDLIVRSSTTDETLHFRGRYRSIRCSADPTSILQAAVEILRHFKAQLVSPAVSSEQCALLVHPHLPSSVSGHLSNERRVGVKRSFAAEVFGQDGAHLVDSFYLQSNKKTSLPDPEKAIQVREDKPELALRSLARWIDKKIGRAHIEWVACSGNLVVLQCDVEEEREVPAPLAEWNSAVASSPLVDVKLFQAATAAGVADLRKSRSVAIFQECSLPVAPLYLMRRDDVLERVALGEIPPALESDLRALLLFPLILRIDVVAEGNSDWQNLPASAPITVLDQAKAFLLQSLPLAQSRAKRIAELAIVAHHFIPARASAWAECNLQSSRVRIDATWGHPDGLQVFPCDTAYVDEQRHLFLYRRFKDEYLDVASDGSLVRRRNGVPWDKEPALQDSDAEYIALHTLRVAQFLQKSARLMWFVRTDSRAGMPRCFPWICVVDFTEAGDPFLSGLRQTPMEPLPGTVDQARRLVLGRVRRIENEEDLTDFQRSPKDFDLGKRRVAFRPGPKLIRSKEFLERVGRTVSGQRWRLVLEGSTLAHAWYQLRATGVDVESAAEYLTKPRRRKAFGKLVRDRIPDAIKARGELMTSVVLEPSQLREALSRKLVEEALEAHSAGDLDALTEELADVFEVLRALAANTGISLEKVQEIAARKRASKGGFESGYLLVSTGGADNPTDKQHHQVPDLRSVVGEQVATVEVPLVPPLRANRSGSLRVSIGETRLKVSLSYAEGSARVRFEVDRPSPDERQLSLFDTRRTGGSGGKQ